MIVAARVRNTSLQLPILDCNFIINGGKKNCNALTKFFDCNFLQSWRALFEQCARHSRMTSRDISKGNNMNKRFLFVSLKGRNGSYIFLMSAKEMRLFNIFFFVPSKKKILKKEKRRPGGFRISPRSLVGIKAYETKPCGARLLILSLCSSSCDADRRLGLHRRNRFGFLGSFPRCLEVQCESALRNRFYLQYGFIAVIQSQLLSNLIPK